MTQTSNSTELGRPLLPTRLRAARSSVGLTQQAVAESIGVDPNTIARYEAGRIKPSGTALFALAQIYSKPVEWFFGEEEEPQQLSPSMNDESPEPASEAEPLGVIASLNKMGRAFSARFDRLESAVRTMAIAESRAEYDAGGDMPAVRPVEVVEVAAAAGGGAEVYDETVVGRLWFRDDWLDRQAIDPDQCNVISVRGESMEPTLPDGCSILVDRKRREPQEGRIYVMRTDDGLVVKRVGRDEEGRWEIRSDNQAWLPLFLSEDTDIIGEVRWYGVTL